jgi:hypothetical protein
MMNDASGNAQDDVAGALDVENALGQEEQDGLESDCFGPSKLPDHVDLGPESGTFVHSPSLEEAMSALDDLNKILRLVQLTGGGYKDPGLDLVLRTRLEEMKQFLWTYVSPQSVAYNKWMAASLHTATYLEKKPHHARLLCERTRDLISDRDDLPFNIYGTWNESALDQDETLAQEIHLHLQSIGKYVKAMDLVDFLDTLEMCKRIGVDRQINFCQSSTAS